MPSLVLARACMTRAMMTSRLPRKVSVAGRKVAAAAVWVVDVGLDDVGVVATEFVDAVLEEAFDLWPLVLVLKGFAMGARLISVEVAREATLPEIATMSSAVARRRSSIYCTPRGRTALFGWVEVSEMTGAG